MTAINSIHLQIPNEIKKKENNNNNNKQKRIQKRIIILKLKFNIRSKHRSVEPIVRIHITSPLSLLVNSFFLEKIHTGIHKKQCSARQIRNLGRQSQVPGNFLLLLVIASTIASFNVEQRVGKRVENKGNRHRNDEDGRTKKRYG